MCDVIVVLVVPRSRMRIEQVISRQQFKELIPPRRGQRSALRCHQVKERQRGQGALTIALADQMSTLVPHFAPRIASGLLYCLVWMSFVKCKSVQLALPRSAILTVMRSRVDGSYGAGGGSVVGSPATGAGWSGFGGRNGGGDGIEPSAFAERIVTSESLSAAAASSGVAAASPASAGGKYVGDDDDAAAAAC